MESEEAGARFMAAALILSVATAVAHAVYMVN
jgi:hypothetical protein